MTGRASARAEEIRRKAEKRLAEEEPSSRKGVAIGWVTSSRAADIQLHSLVLAAYLFLTIVPALVVIATYVRSDPHAAATRLNERLHLTGRTADLVREVLAGAAHEKFTAMLIAVVSAVIFGLGIGRTLQVVYARIWRIPAPAAGVTENLRYLLWLVVLVLGAALYVVEAAMLRETDLSTLLFAPLWIGATVGFLTWTPVFLLHRRIEWRDALPGALITTAGLLALRVISVLVFTNWLNWYAEYYGGLGIAIALVFWLALITSVFIVGAALAPAYAVRRESRAADLPSGEGR